MIKPEELAQLHDPDFLAYLDERCGGGPLVPEEQDYDRSTAAHTDVARAYQYRLAQAGRLQCLFGEWKAGKN